MIKILHTGDVHLDSPFASATTAQSEVRRAELRATFTSMMTYARMNGVDMVLIAGDLFDNKYVSRETVSLLSREFAAVGCPVVICPGNHDFRSSDSVWEKGFFPDNVYVFGGEELECFSFPRLNTDVYGYAFTSAYMDHFPAAGHSPENKDRINILLAHGDLSSPSSRNAPITREDIVSFGADYTALGHIHSAENYSDEKLGFAYCGCPEGRDFGECGPKGAVLVQAEKGSVKMQRIRFSKRIYEDDAINVTGASSLAQIDEKIRDHIAARRFGAEHIVRLTLTGQVDSSLVVSPSAFLSAGDRLFSLEIRDMTSPTFDEETMLADGGIRGECYRMLKERLSDGTERDKKVADAAMRYAMAALAGESLADV